MTTATAEWTPTEEAILRQAFEGRLAEPVANVIDNVDSLRAALERIALTAASPLLASVEGSLEPTGDHGMWEPLVQPAGAFWIDLRPSEAVALRDMVAAACERAQARCAAVIVEELLDVVKIFGHPDAPRGSAR